MQITNVYFMTGNMLKGVWYQQLQFWQHYKIQDKACAELCELVTKTLSLSININKYFTLPARPSAAFIICLFSTLLSKNKILNISLCDQAKLGKYNCQNRKKNCLLWQVVTEGIHIIFYFTPNEKISNFPKIFNQSTNADTGGNKNLFHSQTLKKYSI